ncbi:phage baseplate assembly protein V [Wohlfahrtiimonas larvae]|uniref:Phage baseplate assembly protein V n=2 Tax=Wohlfahrtiimonas larvae TaxID=1157986 RepID=A0ABP9MWI3_9GAMM
MTIGRRIKGIAQGVSQSARNAFRGVLSATNSAQSYQSAQVEGLDEEVIQDAELYQHFGFTSNPPAGTKAIVIPLHGLTSHSVIIATENGNFRVQALKSGEVCLYNQSGASITLKNGRVIDVDCDAFNLKTKHYTCIAETHVTSSSGGITLDAPMTAITGGLSAGFGGNTRSSYTASFNMKISALDGVFGGISFLGHGHIDSIGGKTTEPK